MIERLDQDRCTGCGRCVAACPMDVLRLAGEGRAARARIVYPEDCMSCFNCERDCPVEGVIFVNPRRSRYIPLPW